jgi:hypothetical protein
MHKVDASHAEVAGCPLLLRGRPRACQCASGEGAFGVATFCMNGTNRKATAKQMAITL